MIGKLCSTKTDTRHTILTRCHRDNLRKMELSNVTTYVDVGHRTRIQFEVSVLHSQQDIKSRCFSVYELYLADNRT